MTDMNFFHRKENVDFQKFIENRVIRSYRQEEVIFVEGQASAYMFYIRSGKVKTYKSSYPGKELVIAIHEQGDCIGHVALIGNAPYTESAVALTETDLTLIPKQDFLSSLYSNREIARNFLVMLSNSVHEVENRLVELAYQSLTQKVMRALLRLHSSRRSASESTVISVSRKDLANLVGTTPESLNRALQGLQEEGLIDLSGNAIRLLDQSPRSG